MSTQKRDLIEALKVAEHRLTEIANVLGTNGKVYWLHELEQIRAVLAKAAA